MRTEHPEQKPALVGSCKTPLLLLQRLQLDVKRPAKGQECPPNTPSVAPHRCHPTSISPRPFSLPGLVGLMTVDRLASLFPTLVDCPGTLSQLPADTHLFIPTNPVPVRIEELVYILRRNP